MPITTALILVGGVFLLLAIHPFITYPLSLLLLRRLRGIKVRQRERETAKDQLSIAFVLCAYNEASVIEEKIKNLIEIRRSLAHCSIHVYADGCSDDTVAKLERYRDDVRVVAGVGRKGKSAGMGVLMKGVDADLVAFTDANVIITPASALLMAGYFADSRVGCVCGQLTYSNPNESTTAAAGSAYWKFEEWLKRTESDVDSTVAADGALFVVRRKLWNEVPADIIDDACTSTSVFCRGLDVVQADDIHAWEKGAVSTAEEFRRKIRISCRTFNCTLFLWSKLRATSLLRQYMYFSHKLLRWLILFHLIAAGLCLGVAAAMWSLKLFLVCSAILIASLALGVAGMRPFSSILEILVSITAAGLGVIQSARGKRYVTWTPPGSTRESPQIPAQTT